MKISIIILMILVFILGCSNSLPLPGNDNVESILIIPHKATNTTNNPFGF